MKTTQKKLKKHNRKRKEKQEKKKANKQDLVFMLGKTIWEYFPNLFEKIKEIPDCRRRNKYEITELIMGAIAIFFLKKSREMLLIMNVKMRISEGITRRYSR